MGRRSLRKVDPALDLARHLKTWDDLPRPWSAVLLFDRDAPLEIEVGSGKGLFLAAASVERPDHNFLGIEIAAKYARFAAARLANRAIPNAIVLNADAQRLFRELLPDSSVAAVHVYFPDPWWKARHKKRRVMNESFVRRCRTNARRRRLTALLDRRGGVLPRRRSGFWPTTTRLTGPSPVAEQPAGTRPRLSHPLRAAYANAR